MNSPIKWVGSKRQLKKKIVGLMPEHVCYVEPFVGGGSVFFEKSPSKVEVLNDIDSKLINFYEVLRTQPNELIERIDSSTISRKLFLEYRESDWNELDDLEKAFRFYYITKCSFGGLFRFNQQGKCNSPFAGSPSPKAKSSLYSSNTYKLLKQGHKRIQNAIIECDDYKNIIKRYDTPDTFFFFDPPYDTDYAYGVKFDYQELLDYCRILKGRFLLTLNAELSEMFKEFNIINTEVNYSVTCKKGDNKKAEVIIFNY